ncbi:hypothetical protein ACIRO1_40340 [Streptomyces sp. NPDC102381]|uniref:hypothetical protein n=1 Tax=Streptomyces sp. NPDC102381 TaxID=3366164 RepID=UPI00382E6562
MLGEHGLYADAVHGEPVAEVDNPTRIVDRAEQGADRRPPVSAGAIAVPKARNGREPDRDAGREGAAAPRFLNVRRQDSMNPSASMWDCLAVAGEDLRGRPWADSSAALLDVLADIGPSLDQDGDPFEIVILNHANGTARPGPWLATWWQQAEAYVQLWSHPSQAAQPGQRPRK